jgi:hypothetical protein
MYVTNSSTSTDSFVVYTPGDTSLYITSGYSTVPIEYANGNVDKNIVYRKRAIRTPRKKPGDITNANDPKNRIKNLLKPIVVFKFTKDRFRMLERKELTARLEKVSQILESTHITNQIALRDKIQDKFGKFLREQEMITCGFTKYLEREILQAFIDSVKDKAIKITPVKNYIRLIPKDVKESMEIAKDKKLFDDFVVIHCDPENKAIEKTREEKKDPILCGVIKESPRYYFVGDWQDELCDLTMDQILEKLDLTEEDVSLPEDVETALLEIL